MQLKQAFKKSWLLAVVFALCFIYWGYLFCSSEILLKHDALGYRKLGSMLYHQGWLEYFRTGPNREPLYPWLVSNSMRIADSFSISYLAVQKGTQIILLFLTQLLVLLFLRILKINKYVAALTILYVGFSPSLVNAAFSLYSEIAACPSVIAIAIVALCSWRAIHLGEMGKAALWGILTALLFIAASSVKAIFQYVYLAFILPYVFVFLHGLYRKNTKITRNAAAFVTISFILFASFGISYRALNKKYNGKFDFTNRYDVLLFGNAGVRTEKLSPRFFMARIAAIPGGGFCRKFFSEEACLGAEFHHSDAYWPPNLNPLLEGAPQSEVAKRTINLTIRKIGENPLQYAFLTFVEGLKMAFWESTQIGFVQYPPVLEKLFLCGPFKDGLRLAVSFVTYAALIFLLLFVIGNRKEIRRFDSEKGKRVQAGFFIMLVVITYTGLYSMFAVLTRFGIPMAPLYLTAIAVFIHLRQKPPGMPGDE